MKLIQQRDYRVNKQTVHKRHKQCTRKRVSQQIHWLRGWVTLVPLASFLPKATGDVTRLSHILDISN